MKLSVSTAARTRDFSRMMRRLDPMLMSLASAFEDVALQHPIHEAILIAVAQDLPESHFDEKANSDGYFQVFVGWPDGSSTSPDADADNRRQLFAAIRRVVAACPFSDPDRLATLAAIDNWANDNLDAAQ